MRMNTSIPMMGQQPDIVGSAARGFEAGRRNRLADIYNQHGAGIASGDQNAMNALAQFDPTAAMEAQRGHQIMQHADSQEGRLNRQEQRMIEAEAAKMDAAQRAAEAQKIEEAVKMGLALPDATAWDQTMSQMQPELVGQFDNRQMLANRFLSVAEVLKGMQGPEFTQITGEEAAASGLDPTKVYNVGRDGKISSIGGGVNVSVNTGSEVGTIPQGYELITDPETGARSLRVIKGGPEDTTKFDKAKESRADTASDVIINAASKIRGAAKDQDFGPTGTTMVGKLPWTDSAEVVRQVAVLKAQASAGSLQQMRDASKTGGALGNVTEKELTLLENLAGALDPNAPTFLEDLELYERTLLRTVHGKEAGDQIFEQSREGPSDGPVKISSDADYEALPSGAEFIAPDGSRRRKP